MKKGWRWFFIVLGLFLVVIFFGPLLIPVPPLQGTVPADQLADPDSLFAVIDDIQVHYKEQGAGNPALLLLHGFAASTYSWREVMEPLSAFGRVVAYDRPAFGFTERPMNWEGANPYAADTQPDLLVALLDDVGIGEAILVGNSAGGTVAIQTALRYPERVKALVLVDPAVYVGDGLPLPIRLLANSPQGEHLGPLYARSIQDWGYDFGRRAWHDPERFTDEIWENYTKPLRAENWDRALWEMFSSSGSPGLEQRLSELTLPVLVITGDDDRIVPPEQSMRLAGELPNAELVIIPACGHVPQEECPEPFLQAVEAFLANLAENS